jgi:hypothetical protein
LAQRSSRKRRKQRRRAATAPNVTADAGAARNGAAEQPPAVPRGYARGRAKDEATRGALKPLAPGERPTVVTVGAIVAAIAALANLVALVAGYDPDEPRKTVTTVLGLILLVLVAGGMWGARYWAVLGMQTLLALTIILSSLALLTAVNALAGLLALVLVAGCGTLFWFLVKAMARIQMPQRPGSDA